MASLDELYGIDDRHQAFEHHTEGLLVSRAGPGTGKTYSFLRRITALNSQQSVELHEICYLTFIKEITRAFLSDYEQEFGEDQDVTNRPRISTLHSFACRLIRNRGFSIGLDGSLYFASVADREAETSKVFLTDLLPLVSSAGPRTLPQLRRVLERIKEAWRDDNDPETLYQPIPSILQNSLTLAQAYRLVDWDQAIPMAHSLFLDPRNRQQWLTQINHYLVDEFQDFNTAEQSFILTLQSTVKSMVVVGDDNQSLYSGRGGSPDGLEILSKSPDNDHILLLRCRRCKANILNTANKFLLSMSPRAEPLLPYEAGGEVLCYKFKSSKAEIAFLIEYLTNRIDQIPERPTPKDGIVCLFPLRKALRFYFERIRSEIPCYTTKAEPHPLRQQLSRLLELVFNPHQRFIERLILESFSSIKPRHKREMVRLILEKDVSPSEAMDLLASNGSLPPNAAEDAHAFADLCQALSSQDADAIAATIDTHIRADADELREQVANLLRQVGDSDQDELIDSFCDRVLPESSLPIADPRAVMFLTMHGSKGLSKNTVVMPGLEDAWLPGTASGPDLDERKRLFYVALTRATDHVLITYPRTRSKGDPLNFRAPGRCEICRFVTDISIPDIYHS